jgi:hypothetical protein
MEGFSSAELLFFQGREAALPLYAAVRDRVLAVCPRARIDVKKTQISFFARYMFAAVSFLPVGRAQDRPKPFLTLSLCLPARPESLPVAAASEPYPGRWTVHVLLGGPEDVDETLTGYLSAAVDFAERKGRRA